MQQGLFSIQVIVFNQNGRWLVITKTMSGLQSKKRFLCGANGPLSFGWSLHALQTLCLAFM